MFFRSSDLIFRKSDLRFRSSRLFFRKMGLRFRKRDFGFRKSLQTIDFQSYRKIPVKHIWSNAAIRAY